MISRADFHGKLSFTKDLIAAQNFVGLMGRLNSGGLVFTGDGLGTTTATSTSIAIALAGLSDQRVVVVGKYITPTASGSENFGAVLRCTGFEVSADTSYYYARCNAGVARISRFSQSSTSNTTLDSAAYVLPQNTFVTIDFQIVGSALTAIFTAAGGSPAPLTLSAIDASPLPAGGFMLARTTSSTGFFSSISGYQL